MSDLVIKQDIENVNLSAVSESLSLFINGNGSTIKGLGGTLGDIVRTKDLLASAGTILGTATVMSDAAATVEDFADGLQDSLTMVSKLGGVLGGAFNRSLK